MPYGSDGKFGVALQNSFGTQNISSLYWFPILNEGVTLKRERLVSQNMRGSFDASDVYAGTQTNDGAMEFEIDAKSIGVILAAMNSALSVVTSGGVKTHIMSPRQSDHNAYSANRPMTIHKDLADGGSAFIYYDMVPSALGLSVANGEFLKASVEFVGGKFTQSATVAATYPDNKLFTWDTVSVSMGGVGQVDLTEFNLKINDNIANQFALNGAKTPVRNKRTGFREVSVEGTMIFVDQTQMQNFLVNTVQNLTFYAANSTAVQSGYYESLKIVASKLQLTSFEPSLSGPGLIEAPFTAMANLDTAVNTATSNGATLLITLTNSHTGY